MGHGSGAIVKPDDSRRASGANFAVEWSRRKLLIAWNGQVRYNVVVLFAYGKKGSTTNQEFVKNGVTGGCFKLKQRNDIQPIGGGVKEAGWGQRSIRFYDLDGHMIEAGENMKMVVKRFLNSGLTMEEAFRRMDVSVADLETLLHSEINSCISLIPFMETSSFSKTSTVT